MHRRMILQVVPIMTLALLGCEGNTTYEIEVANQTKAGITLEVEPNFGEGTDTVLMPGTSVTVYLWDKRGGTSAPTNPADLLKSFTIINQQDDTLVRDYQVMENWVIEIEHRKKVPSDYYHRYTFDAGPNDF